MDQSTHKYPASSNTTITEDSDDAKRASVVAKWKKAFKSLKSPSNHDHSKHEAHAASGGVTDNVTTHKKKTSPVAQKKKLQRMTSLKTFFRKDSKDPPTETEELDLPPPPSSATHTGDVDPVFQALQQAAKYKASTGGSLDFPQDLDQAAGQSERTFSDYLLPK